MTNTNVEEFNEGDAAENLFAELELDSGNFNIEKLDARRRLEDYLDQKRLEKELYGY